MPTSKDVTCPVCYQSGPCRGLGVSGKWNKVLKRPHPERVSRGKELKLWNRR